MSDPVHLIGRFAKVVECDDTTWIGRRVEVRNYFAKEGKYEVASTINKVDGQECTFCYLNFSQLRLFSPTNFLSRFPNAPVVLGRHDLSEIPIGCVADFSQCDSPPAEVAHLKIEGTCRVVGNRRDNEVNQVNTINNNVVVNASADDLIEFENVQFSSEHWGVKCVAGNIVFRSCSFHIYH